MSDQPAEDRRTTEEIAADVIRKVVTVTYRERLGIDPTEEEIQRVAQALRQGVSISDVPALVATAFPKREEIN